MRPAFFDDVEDAPEYVLIDAHPVHRVLKDLQPGFSKSMETPLSFMSVDRRNFAKR